MPSDTTIAYFGAVGGLIAAIAAGIALLFAYRSAKASELSAEAAKATVDHQLAVHRDSLLAKVILLPRAELERQGESVRVRMTALNLGPANATDIRVTLTLPEQQYAPLELINGLPLETTTFPILPPIRPVPLDLLWTEGFGNAGGWLNLILSYKDDLEARSQTFWLKISGSWEEDWAKGIHPERTEPPLTPFNPPK